jgi:hypothetical protein
MRDLSHKDIMFTDSSYITPTGYRSGRRGAYKWVRRSKENTQHVHKTSIQVHVYGGISWHGLTDLHVVSGTTGFKRDPAIGEKKTTRGVGALEYQHVLTTTLLPGARDIFPRGTQWVFMQDGAPGHRAKTTKAMLDRECPNWIKDWPANSPDLNPIENVWAYMSDKIKKQRFNTIEDLKVAVLAEWRRIPLQYIRKLVGGMWRRHKAVIRNKGGPTDY